MTNQEFFDAFVAHLRRQGRKAVLDDCGCAYTVRDENGKALHCGIGGVMPPQMLEELEHGLANSLGISSLISARRSVAEYFAGVDPALLVEAQRVHDSFVVALWESAFQRMAEHFGLNLKEK